MSGIFGLYDLGGTVDFDKVAQEVREFQLPGSAPHRIEFAQNERTFVGRYHLDIFKQPKIKPLESSGTVIITAGYRVGDYPATCLSPNSGFDRQTLQQIDELIRSKDWSQFSRFDGAFQIMQIAPKSGDLTIIVDRCGLLPLYVYTDNRLLAFAPDFSLLFALLGFTPPVNREALLEICEIGFVTGERTLFEKVHVIAPGSITQSHEGRLKYTRYWRPKFADRDRTFDAEKTAEALHDALTVSVRQRCQLARTSVSLSGGLDSRVLLVSTQKSIGDAQAYTFGPRRSREGEIAGQVARRLKVPLKNYVDSAATTAGILKIGVRKSGGLSNVVDFAGLSHLVDIARHTDVVVNGYGGNELLGFLAFDLYRFRRRRDPHYLSQWLAAKLNPGWPTAELTKIRHHLSVDQVDFAERIEGHWSQYPAESSLSQVYHFYFEQKARRANLLGVTADTLYLEPVVPFYANEVIDLALTIPPEQRLFARFYRRFISKYYSSVVDIEYSRTGLPANAPLTAIVAGKVIGKLKRPSEPDEPWNDWLRGALRNYLYDYFLAGKPETGDYLGREPVVGVVEGFLQGKNYPARIIGQLLSIELFLRIFGSGTK